MPDNNPISKARQLQIKVAAREAERLRIGQDLHDAFGGNLTGASLLLAKISSQFQHASPEQAETLQQLRDLLSDSQRKLQQVIHDLRPPELENGLLDALRLLCRKWQGYTGLQCTLQLRVAGSDVPHSNDSDASDDGAAMDEHDEKTLHLALNDEQALALYRIAQEGLNNVARHAQARIATVTLLHAKTGITLKIADNGKTACKKRLAGAGLTGISERVAALAGSFQMEDLIGQGHCLTVQIPATELDGRPPETPLA